MPLAEHTALIRPLTLWVLERAAAQCRRWRDAGHDLSVAVNLSAANLADPGLPGDVAGILARLRLPALGAEAGDHRDRWSWTTPSARATC